MEPCVSIIVPVYNAETTLRRCVESVLGQEYTDFELILADDGSQDNSGALCDTFALADGRVRVLHKENSGVSDTRNQAMDMVQGRYLQFLDADDWITPNATKLLVRAAEEYQCDLVVSDFYRVVGERVSPKGDIDEDRPLTREEYAAHMMENPADFYYGVLWNKLYRRDVIEEHHLRMAPELSWCEDFLFNLEYILHVRRIFALQVPVYYYVKTKGSLVTQGKSISKTVQMKLTLFEYYQQFYRTVLDEAEYAKRRLKVYRFLFDAAQDGAVLPLAPGSTRLGEERTQVHSDTLAGNGVLFDWFRERKLLDYYLEPVARKNGLTLPEASLLLYLDRFASGSRRELTDFSGMPKGNLSRLLQRLNAQGLISAVETYAQAKREKQLRIMFSPTGKAVLAELERVWEDFEEIRLSHFSDEEREQYAQLTRRVQSNIQTFLRADNYSGRNRNGV